jgi:hypothetical protein
MSEKICPPPVPTLGMDLVIEDFELEFELTIFALMMSTF